MSRINFQQKLGELKERLLVMAGLVEQGIQRSTEAYLSKDLQLCELVMQSEPAINRMEREIDRFALDSQGPAVRKYTKCFSNSKGRNWIALVET